MTPPTDRTELTAALRLALQYVAKGQEQGAYDGCVLSGSTVLDRIAAALAHAEANPTAQEPTQC